MNNPKEIKHSIDKILEVDTEILDKAKSLSKKQQLFSNILKRIILLNNRSDILTSEFGVDLSAYDTPAVELVDDLLELLYGKVGKEIIYFYLFGRTNPDGSINTLKDKEDKPITLNTESDLLYVLSNIKNK